MLAVGTVGFVLLTDEGWAAAFYRSVVSTTLTGLDSRPEGTAARALHRRPPPGGRGNLPLPCGRGRRADHARGRRGVLRRRTEEKGHRPAARPHDHLRLRPRRPQRRGGVRARRQHLRRDRRQRRLDRGGGRDAAPTSCTGTGPRTSISRRPASRMPAPSSPRPTPTSRISSSRSPPAPPGPTSSSSRVRPTTRRRASCTSRAPTASCSPTPPRAPDREPRPQAAGRRLPRHRLDGRRRRAPLRGDHGRGDVPGRRASASRPPHPRCDRSDDRRDPARHGCVRRHARPGRGARHGRRADRRRLDGGDPPPRGALRPAGGRRCADPVEQLAAALAEAAGRARHPRPARRRGARRLRDERRAAARGPDCAGRRARSRRSSPPLPPRSTASRGPRSPGRASSTSSSTTPGSPQALASHARGRETTSAAARRPRPSACRWRWSPRTRPAR